MRDDPLRLDALIRPVVEGLGYELWGIDYRAHKNNALLRIYIDRDEGITLDDCTLVSGQVSALLDVEDPIGVPYTLEVSSPGLDRLLFAPGHYERFAGHNVKIRLRWPVEGRRNVAGVLVGLRDRQNVVVNVDSQEYVFPLDAVEQARLIPEV